MSPGRAELLTIVLVKERSTLDCSHRDKFRSSSDTRGICIKNSGNILSSTKFCQKMKSNTWRKNFSSDLELPAVEPNDTPQRSEATASGPRSLPAPSRSLHAR